MERIFVPLFQHGSFLIFAIALAVMLIRYREQREYVWVLIAMFMAFPFEWYADENWMFLYYRSAFLPLFGDFPLFMPFAWAWFFGIALAIMLAKRDAIARLPLWMNIAWMTALFFAWDFLVEAFFTSSAGGRLWVYYGYPESLMLTKTLPWTIPVFVGMSLPILYYANLWALKHSTRQGSWLRGLLIHVVATYIALSAQVAVGYPFVRAVLDLPTEPRPPMEDRLP